MVPVRAQRSPARPRPTSTSFTWEITENVGNVEVTNDLNLTTLFHFQKEVLTHIGISNYFASLVTEQNLTKLDKKTCCNIGFARERAKCFVSIFLLNLKFGSSIER